MSTEPQTAPELEPVEDDDIIEVVVLLRLRRAKTTAPGMPPVDRVDVEYALAAYANATPAFPVRPRHDTGPLSRNITAEYWIIERNTVSVHTDSEQVEAARWAVTPQ